MVVGGSLLSTGESKTETSPLSMLSTKAMPVDAYKIRNSLFLTVCRITSRAVAVRVDGGIVLPATDAQSGASFRKRSRA